MNDIMKMIINKTTYMINKNAKVGELLYCPSCGHPFIKEHYQQAFCKTKGGTICKDKYWNWIDPKKRNNTTRISPANASYYERIIRPRMEAALNNFDDDPSWDAHKGSF
jgi:hypothetical protein